MSVLRSMPLLFSAMLACQAQAAGQGVVAVPEVQGCGKLAPASSVPSPIGAIQGRGERSERIGETVTIEGRVTGDFAEGLNGWFVQDDGDGDAKTSDALFISSSRGMVVHRGMRLRATGTVTELDTEHGPLTALIPCDVTASGPIEYVPAMRIKAPQDWEALEGMLVRIDAPLTLNSTDTRFGETIASFDGRLWTPTELAAPGSDKIKQVEADNARRRLVLDDGSNRRDPGQLWYLPEGIARGGSVGQGVQGIVDQRHGSYRLQLTEPLHVTAAKRPPAPKVDGKLKVAVFNLENLFNGDGQGGGFPTRRGAKSPAQLKSQTDKLVATLSALDADIAALMELENDGYGPHSSLAQFVDALNADGGDWRFVDAGQGPGQDDIRVGLVYRASKVTALGKPAVLEGGPFGDRSRVPLAQAFKRGDGQPFVVVANHLKSKGCSEAEGADRDQGDGQGCWNALRVESAKRLDAWLENDPTGHGSALKLMVGDFNAYAMEDPVRTLRDAGWKDAFTMAGAKRPYSYVYNGQSGRLDHALLSPELAKRLKGAAEWHSNADEPDGEGYAGKDVAGPWRSSDHDPMLLGFDL